MRSLTTLLTISTLTAGFLFSAGPVPRKAPEFVIQHPDGKQELLSSYHGKTVVLALMFTTCAHCQKAAGILAGVQKEYEGKGVQVLGATIDPNANLRIQQFNQVFGVNFPCGVSNESAARQFLGLKADEPYFVPILVFIDKTGTIRSQYIGDEKFLANEEVNIRAELDKIMKGPAGSQITAKNQTGTKPQTSGKPAVVKGPKS